MASVTSQPSKYSEDQLASVFNYCAKVAQTLGADQDTAHDIAAKIRYRVMKGLQISFSGNSVQPRSTQVLRWRVRDALRLIRSKEYSSIDTASPESFAANQPVLRDQQDFANEGISDDTLEAFDYMTEPRKLILIFIIRFIQEHGYSPTVNEISEALCMNRNTTDYYIVDLVKNKYLSHKPGQMRTISVRKDPMGRDIKLRFRLKRSSDGD